LRVDIVTFRTEFDVILQYRFVVSGGCVSIERSIEILAIDMKRRHIVRQRKCLDPSKDVQEMRIFYRGISFRHVFKRLFCVDFCIVRVSINRATHSRVPLVIITTDRSLYKS